MRAALTPPEIALWVQLKGRKLDGLHFRRQHPLGPYIIDFYCSAARLAIEVDGYSQGVGDALAHDARRDSRIESQGVETLRLPAGSVIDDMASALETILAAVRRHAPSVSFADSSPARGGA